MEQENYRSVHANRNEIIRHTLWKTKNSFFGRIPHNATPSLEWYSLPVKHWMIYGQRRCTFSSLNSYVYSVSPGPRIIYFFLRRLICSSYESMMHSVYIAHFSLWNGREFWVGKKFKLFLLPEMAMKLCHINSTIIKASTNHHCRQLLLTWIVLQWTECRDLRMNQTFSIRG